MAPAQYTCPCPLVQLPHAPPFPLEQLRHAQAGCADCLDSLMAQHEPLVHWVLRHEGRAPLGYAEAVQAGRLGLWQAVLHFDPARGTAFSTYAVVAIRRHLQQERQRSRRFWRPLPRALPNGRRDPLEIIEEALDQAQLARALAASVARLPPRRAQLLRARYGLQGQPPQRLRELAQAAGITRQRVQQLLAEAQLRLALPLYSWEVRQLRGCTSTVAIQTALRAWQRFRRRQQRRGR